MKVLIEGTTFVKCRDGVVRTVLGDIYGMVSLEIPESTSTAVLDGLKVHQNHNHNYDITEQLTPKSHPELYL